MIQYLGAERKEDIKIQNSYTQNSRQKAISSDVKLKEINKRLMNLIKVKILLHLTLYFHNCGRSEF